MSKRIVFFLLTLAAATGIARAQSLADVAKKEGERRKALPAPVKVYTNKDLNAVPPPPVPASKPADAKSGEKAETAAPDAKEPAKDQAYWSGRLKKLQDQLTSDKAFVEALQSRINALTTDFVNRDDPGQKAVIETNRQKAVADLVRQTKAVKDDEKALADLLEEARRAGVPPGWMR